MFNVGDYIVYPMHGAGTIDAIEEKDILGQKQAYYIIKMPGEVKVMNEVADVVRNLSFKQKEKGLSTGEKKMLTNAKQILVSELALAQSLGQEAVEGQIDDKIATSFKTFRMDGVEENTVVNKFIPFDDESDTIVG